MSLHQIIILTHKTYSNHEENIADRGHERAEFDPMLSLMWALGKLLSLSLSLGSPICKMGITERNYMLQGKLGTEAPQVSFAS